MKITTAFILTTLATALAAPAPHDPDMAIDIRSAEPEEADALPIADSHDLHESYDYGYGYPYGYGSGHWNIKRDAPEPVGNTQSHESKAWWGGGYGWRPYGWNPYWRPYWGWGGGYGRWGGGHRHW